MTTKMSKVFDVYASRKGVQASCLRFLLDGERINADKTPKQLEMEDQDQIDCILEGGGSGSYIITLPPTAPTARGDDLAVPRVVDGIEGAVVGMTGGQYHSLVTTAEGRVLAFGGKNLFAQCGCLGLGAGVIEALTPTVIDGITLSERDEGEEGKE